MTVVTREGVMEALCGVRDALEDVEGNAAVAELDPGMVRDFRRKADSLLQGRFAECCGLKPLVSFDLGTWRARCPFCGRLAKGGAIGACEASWNGEGSE